MANVTRRFKSTIYLQVETSNGRLTAKEGREFAVAHCANLLGGEMRRGALYSYVKSFEEVTEIKKKDMRLR